MKKYLIITILLLSTCVFAQEVEKYYCPTMTDNFILYMVDPERVAGWCVPLRDYEKEFMDAKYASLPVLGGWRENGLPSYELLLKMKIKKAFIADAGHGEYSTEKARELEKLGIRNTIIKANKLEDFPPLLRQLGQELGIPERGEELALFGENAINRTKEMVKDIPDIEKKRVYWALGPNGLSTSCNGIIELAGGINVHECGSSANEIVSFEQVLSYNPDVIIIINPVAAKIMNDLKFQRLRAYKEGNMYVVPFGPFGWMHSPEIVRFLGIQWLACTLYPDKCTVDIDKEAKAFTKLFMHYDLSDTQLDKIMHRKAK